MRLYTLCILVLFVSLTYAVYIPHPTIRDLLVPVRLDLERPRIRLQRVLVEEPPNRNRLLELLYLVAAVPFLFTGIRGGVFGNRVNGNGNGGGGIVTEDPCC